MMGRIATSDRWGLGRYEMTCFEMIKYHNQKYPDDIPLRIEEIAAHFDISVIGGQLCRSLHTEYSYGKRKFNSVLISNYPEICRAHKDGVPQLWKNDIWASQFADFIFSLVNIDPAPRVIEIHPPFIDYTNMDGFISVYTIFEKKIKERFPSVEILIENRCGSVYRGGKFLISTLQDMEMLCEAVEKTGLQLKIAFDVPQLYTAHHTKEKEAYIELLKKTLDIRKRIGGVHLWGKRLSKTGRKVSHCGDLNSYFGDPDIKADFLHAFKSCFDDDIIRKMVLEVNSENADLLSIVNDLKSVGVQFL